MRKTPLARTAIACTALSLVLTACGGSDDAAPGGSGGDGGAASEAAEPATWPLTGLEAEGGTAAKDHPVFVVKIDNSSSSQPQVGLGKADLVVEELVEGNTTRLASFFYSQLPKQVGPVRSMRASDIGIVKSVGATVVTSGAAGVTIKRIQDAGITFHSEGGPGFARASDRSAPYNLMNDLTAVAKADKGKSATPDPYLEWGAADDLPKGERATKVAADFGGHVTNWAYQNGGYVNVNSYAAQGDQFPADTVLALEVQVGDAGYKDPAGSFVPETKLEGKGKAVLFHGGRAIKATWSKDSVDAPITLETADGTLKVPAGRTWIELVPANDAGGAIRPGKITYQK